MIQGNRKHVLDKFQEYLSENYQMWRTKHHVEKSDAHLVTFMIDQDLIPSTQIQRFTITEAFAKLREEPYFQKTQAVHTLAHRFNVSERTVWNILKHRKTINEKNR